jgi:hypothetical protein
MQLLRAIFLVAALTAAWPAAASACSCMFSDLQARVEMVDFVLAGAVTGVRTVAFGFGSDVEATIRVDRVFKGSVPRRIRVRTAAQSSACGEPLLREKGEQLLLFVSRDEAGDLHTNLCMGNRRLAEADFELAYLEPLGAHGSVLQELVTYPSPARSQVQIAFSLEAGTFVEGRLFDVAGRLVARPFAGHFPEGPSEVTIHTDALPTGIYFLRLRAGARLEERVIVVR